MTPTPLVATRRDPHAAERNDLLGGGVQGFRRHGGGAEDGFVPKAARVEHGAEPAHEPFRTAPTDEVKKVRLRAVQLARERLERARAERDAALEFGKPALFRGIQRHFFSGSSARLYG